jgi:hypothetical protein
LTKVVVSAVPFHLTDEPLTNPLPLTVKVNAAPPASALDGDSDEITGAGLFIGKLQVPEVPPPGAGLVAVMLAVPELVISLAGT